MSDGVDFGAVAMSAATRDLVNPLLTLRQLSLQLGEVADLSLNDKQASWREITEIARKINLTTTKTLDISRQLQLSLQSIELIKLEPVQVDGLCVDVYRELSPLGKEFSCNLRLNQRGLRSKSAVAVGNYDSLRVVLRSLIVDTIFGSVADNDNSRTIEIRSNRLGRAKVELAIIDDKLDANWRSAAAMVSDNKIAQPIVNLPNNGTAHLLLASRIVHFMGGRMVLRSRRQGGSIIGIVLPSSKQLSLWGDAL